MTGQVRTVTIVGRDLALWLTALGLQRAFGRVGVTVQAVELPSQLNPVDVFPALPTINALHDLLGIAEKDVLRFSSGMYVAGQRFANWSRSLPPFMHAYDTVGAPFDRVDFLQYWIKARQQGLNVPYEDFCLGAAAAKQGRFIALSDNARSFSKAAKGFHLDAVNYGQLIKAIAVKRGIAHVEGVLADVAVADGQIASIALADGRKFEADLFVDASGSEGALIGRLGGEPENWGQYFPCNRVMAASGKALSPVPAFSQVLACRAGWIGMYPLQQRTAMTAVYADSQLSDDEMMQSIPVLSGIGVEGDVVVNPLHHQLRREAWTGNCVAIGDAAVTLDPLDAVALHPVHIGLSLLVEFFPTARKEMPEAEVFNAKFARHMENIRDFQLAHYALNMRPDEPVWDAVREQDMPESLARKLRIFRGTGVVSLNEDETFEEENWAQIFVGHNHVPDGYSPLVDVTADEELIQKFQAMLRFIAGEVSEMTSLTAHMEMFAPQRPADGAAF